ncbi:MAG: hypothetical protein DWQ06_00260 [Calditrichaeota bacterium]|nr:MAG: hypothetical protein DWQ06_00260 [Calditrichota bacterium]
MKIVNFLTPFLFVSTSFAATLNFSTFIGSFMNDYAGDVAIDNNGNIIIVGETFNANGASYPTTSGSYLSNPPIGSNNSFIILITSFTSDGSSLNFSTFFGGSTYSDSGDNIELDSNGNIFIQGEGGITTTNNAYATSPIGSKDIYISKFSSDGSSLLNSTYYGGSKADVGYSMEIDSNDNIYLTGKTNALNFPTNTGAYSQNLAGGQDVFVSSLSNDLSSFVFSTYLGSSDDDIGFYLDVHSTGKVVVTGETKSSNFPTTTNAFSTNNTGGVESFTASISNNGSTLDFSTYLGGKGVKFFNDEMVLIGYSVGQNYPISSGAFDSVTNYGYLFSYANDGSSLNYSTYLGGTGGVSLDIDDSGNSYIFGKTSTSTTFSTTSDAFDQNWKSLTISKISSDGSNLIYGSFIGSTVSNNAKNLVYKNGNIYCIGNTQGSTFPTTQGAYSQNFNGNDDIFVFRMDFPKELDDVEISYSNSDVVLNWSEIPTATNYKIYRNTLPDFNSATNIGNLAPSGNQPSFTDVGILQSNLNYYYFVTWEN